jgi:predicted Rossmann fold nucleotide-binding protein DprA/Smf involved in DNA uptake
MQRNQTICALSKAVVLIESGLDGGTFEAGKSALSLGLPLFVIDFENPPDSAEGNQYFLTRGGVGLRPDSSRQVRIQPILDALDGIQATVNSEPKTEFLFPDIEVTSNRRKAKRSAS